MTDNPRCPFCSEPLAEGYLYARGISVSFHRSPRGDVGLMSRKGLTQIDLREISEADVGAQAVIKALHCESCDALAFRSRA